MIIRRRMNSRIFLVVLIRMIIGTVVVDREGGELAELLDLSIEDGHELNFYHDKG